MDGINIIIPLGGIGSRFQKDGYRFPKPFVNIVGRPMIFWVIDNLTIHPHDTIWIPCSTSLETDFQLSVRLKMEYKHDIRVLPMTLQTRGAAETLYIALHSMTTQQLSRKTISLDCDTIYFSDILTEFRSVSDNTGASFYFIDEGSMPIFSYIQLDAGNQITSIREKVKISQNANTGAYAFSSGLHLLEFIDDLLDNPKGEAGEYYTSSVIATMIHKGLSFIGIFVPDFVCVGTPRQLQDFLLQLKSTPSRRQARSPMRFCFDLDNCLVTYPSVRGDLTSVDAIPQNVELVRDLKASGHVIIIYTARGMELHHGNVGRVIADVGQVTIETLTRLNIPYDELIFGKPYADVYVDDLAVNSVLDLHKELGWIAPPPKDSDNCKELKAQTRSFNTIFVDRNHVIKSARGNILDGEVFFYKHIPVELVDLFPRVSEVIDDERLSSGLKSITMEKVDGVTYSSMLVNRCLTIGRLKLLMMVLARIHAVERPLVCSRQLVCSNWLRKVKGRFEQFLPIYTSSFGESSSSSSSSSSGVAVVDKHAGLLLNAQVAVDRLSRHQGDSSSSSSSSECKSSSMNVDDVASCLFTLLTHYEDQGLYRHVSVIHGDPVFTNVLLSDANAVKLVDMRGALDSTLTLEGDANYDWSKLYQSLIGYDFILLDRGMSEIDGDILAALKRVFFVQLEKLYPSAAIEDARFWIPILTAAHLFSILPLHEDLHHRAAYLSQSIKILRETLYS